MEMSKQAELVPSVLNAIEGKPLSHQDRFVCYIFLIFVSWISLSWGKFRLKISNKELIYCQCFVNI